MPAHRPIRTRRRQTNRPHACASSSRCRGSTADAIHPSAARATSSRCPPTSSAMATTWCGRLCAGADRVNRAGRRRRCGQSTRISTGCGGPGASPSSTSALGMDDRGVERRVRHLARGAAAQAGFRPAQLVGRAVRGRGPAARRRCARTRQGPATDRSGARAARGSGCAGGRQARDGPRARAGRCRRALPRSLDLDGARAPAAARRRPCARALRRLVRAVSALMGWLRRRPRAAAAVRRARR